MESVEYIELKQLAIAKYGTDDPETLFRFSDHLEERAKVLKWVSIVICLTAFPLCQYRYGIPMLIFAFALICISIKMNNKVSIFKRNIVPINN